MTEPRALATTPALVLGDAEGDGPVLSLTPPPLNGLVRNIANRLAGPRHSRLMAVTAKIYPILQKIEDRALPDDQKLLQGVSLSKALRDDAKIERGLRLFQSAWRSNLIKIIDPSGKPIPPEKARTWSGACGMTIEAAEVYFIDLALTSIFKSNPKSQRHLTGRVTDPDALAKMRVLAHFQTLALTELIQGLGSQAGKLLSEIDIDHLYGLATLKSYHFRALRQVFGAGFKNIVEWDPETVKAMGTHFECVEQVRDLGEALGVMHGPDAIKALARWETRDVTDNVNAERAQRGLEALAGRRFETDIGSARRILGPYFNTLMEEPPEVLEAFGKLVAGIRTLEKADRADRIEEVRLFCDRFLEYMTTDAMKAIGMTGDNPTGFGEALHILEGLFTKPGLGRKFFEGPLQTPEGVKALAGLMRDIADMRSRGSIKGESEIGQLIANSDILDRHLIPFISFK